MTIKKYIIPILGAGTLLSSRGGFSELRNGKKRPALYGDIHDLTAIYPLVFGLSPCEKLFAIKPKDPT